MSDLRLLSQSPGHPRSCNYEADMVSPILPLHPGSAQGLLLRRKSARPESFDSGLAGEACGSLLAESLPQTREDRVGARLLHGQHAVIRGALDGVQVLPGDLANNLDRADAVRGGVARAGHHVVERA